MKGDKLLTKIWIISILNIILAVAFLYLPIIEVEYKSGKASLSIMEYFENDGIVEIETVETTLLTMESPKIIGVVDEIHYYPVEKSRIESLDLAFVKDHDFWGEVRIIAVISLLGLFIKGGTDIYVNYIKEGKKKVIKYRYPLIVTSAFRLWVMYTVMGQICIPYLLLLSSFEYDFELLNFRFLGVLGVMLIVGFAIRKLNQEIYRKFGLS